MQTREKVQKGKLGQRKLRSTVKLLANGACNFWLVWACQPVLSHSDSATPGEVTNFFRMGRKSIFGGTVLLPVIFKMHCKHTSEGSVNHFSQSDTSASKPWHRCCVCKKEIRLLTLFTQYKNVIPWVTLASVLNLQGNFQSRALKKTRNGTLEMGFSVLLSSAT